MATNVDSKPREEAASAAAGTPDPHAASSDAESAAKGLVSPLHEHASGDAPAQPVAAPLHPALPRAPPAKLPVVEVRELDWQAIHKAVDVAGVRARLPAAVERMEALLERVGGPSMLFDSDRAHADDRVVRVSALDETSPLWIIGDLHGDLLALEAALAQIRHCASPGHAPPRIIFLGDFVDDEGYALEVLVRVFELIVAAPERVCVIAGNHDEALAYDGKRFTSGVSPADFAAFLNEHLTEEWIVRAGKLALRLTAHAARALFFPDGLLVAHGGFPLADLHATLLETGDWNAPACLSDFVWGRAHPKARKKMPNRFSRGSQFGYEDFADFCALSAKLGRPVTHMARGHDHVDERYAMYPAYHAHPVLTTVALSRRLNREQFGPYERAPTLARVVSGCLPQVYQLHLPAELINEVFPQPKQGEDRAGAEPTGGAQP